MKLLDVSQSYLSDNPTDIAGIHIHRQWLALRRRGWDIRVIAPQALFYRELKGIGRYYPLHSCRDDIPIWRPRYLWVPKVLVSYGFLVERFYQQAAFRHLKAITAGWEPDLVVGDFLIPGGLASVKLARHFRVPLVFKTHGHDVRIIARVSAASRLRREYYRAIIEAAEKIVCNGQGLYDQLLGTGLADPQRVLSIPIGVDTDLFYVPSAAERAAVRGQLGLPLEAQVWLFVGRWEHAKGSRELTDVLRRLLGRYPQAHFVAIGPLHDHASRQALEAACERVHFFGPVEPHAVRDYMFAGDLFVLPSYEEGLPSSLLEAMACGLPPIATPVGGIPAVVTHEQDGLLIPPQDCDALEEALVRCASDAAYRARLGQAARRTIAEGPYSLASVGAALHGVFTEVLANGRRAAPAMSN